MVIENVTDDCDCDCDAMDPRRNEELGTCEYLEFGIDDLVKG